MVQQIEYYYTASASRTSCVCGYVNGSGDLRLLNVSSSMRGHQLDATLTYKDRGDGSASQFRLSSDPLPRLAPALSVPMGVPIIHPSDQQDTEEVGCGTHGRVSSEHTEDVACAYP